MKYFGCVACFALGCSGFGAAPSIEAKVTVHARSTDGAPLAGVVLEDAGRRIASGADGAAHLSLAGTEGERRELAVTCPEDYESPSSSLVVSIRRSSNAGSSYDYDVSCAPLRHSIVVVTRAVNGADLPLLYLGQEIGRTNEQGVLHALVRVPAGESLRVTLDTEDRALLPVSPSFDFPSVNHDEIVTVNQVFEPIVVSRPKRLVKKADNRPKRL